jgi:hypothetical protein
VRLPGHHALPALLTFVPSHSLHVRPRHSPTHDPAIDTFKVEYLAGPAFVCALIFNYRFSPLEILWSFSIFLEAVAILPQLFMLQRTGEADTIDTHYLAALGAYRAFYIPNWIYRYWTEGVVDPIAVTAGIVQTGLYLDFFYVYFTRRVPPPSCRAAATLTRSCTQGAPGPEVRAPRVTGARAARARALAGHGRAPEKARCSGALHARRRGGSWVVRMKNKQCVHCYPSTLPPYFKACWSERQRDVRWGSLSH